MEQWAKKWLMERRGKGEKGLEVKTFGGNHYVYRSTTYWDREAKRRRKKSTYLGRLDREQGLIESSGRGPTFKPRTVEQYGNALLLHLAMEDLYPLLKERFSSHWQELYALAMVRIQGYVPLKRVKSLWEKLYSPMDMSPSLSPGNLSRVLKEVGIDNEGQNYIFRELSARGRQFVYDLSVVFTRSAGVNLAELGYNKSKLPLPQLNLALFYSADKGLPTMLRALPGSVKDISSLYNSVVDMGIEGKVLILDRGFFSRGVISFLMEHRISFVLPAKKNSKLYATRIHLTRHFFYQERLIKHGKRKVENGYFLYLFADVLLRAEEEKTLFELLDKGKVDRKDLNARKGRAGRILIVSDLDIEGEEIFHMYKHRDGVEKLFSTYKNMLHADRIYLQEDESVMGHLFVSFLAMYGYCKLQLMLKKANLLKSLSPRDLLEEFAKVYMLRDGERKVITEVPKKVAEMEKALEVNVFPKSKS